MNYKHRQVGTVIIASMAAAAILVLFTMKDAPGWVPYLTVGILLLVGILFNSLTVEVRQGKLRCWFGPGLIRKEFSLEDIKDARAVRNRWWYGWGIRYTPHGWLFNVSGLDAVDITRSSGKHFRIGTDQPKELERAIRHAAGLAEEWR